MLCYKWMHDAGWLDAHRRCKRHWLVPLWVAPAQPWHLAPGVAVCGLFWWAGEAVQGSTAHIVVREARS